MIMALQMRMASFPKPKWQLPVRRTLLWIGIVLLAVFLGVAIAVLPAGFLIRLLVLPIGVCFLALCWVMRSKRSGLPGGLVLTLLLFAAALSVIWPRYIFFSIGGPHVNPQTLSIFAALVVIAFWMTYSPEFSGRVFRTLFSGGHVGLFAVLWLAWRLVAALLGEVPLLSVVELVRDTIYLSSFILIGAAIASYDHGPRLLLRVLLVSGLFVAGAGLVEAFVQNNYFVRFASGGDSQQVADALRTIALDKVRGGAYRAQAVFDHPIVFAQFVAAMIPLGIYFFVYEKGWFWRSVGFLVVPVGILAILKSGSRSGLVSLAVVFAFVGVVAWLRSYNSRGFGKAVAIAALPGVFFGLLIAYFVVQELVVGRSHVEAGSSSVRLKMLMDGVSALADSPLWGFGHGMAIYKAGVISGTTGLATIDSYLLTIALDSGYIGLFLFIMAVSAFAFKGAVAAVRLSGADGARVGLLVAAVLAIVATFAGLSIPNNLTLMWLLITASLPLVAKAEKTVQRRL